MVFTCGAGFGGGGSDHEISGGGKDEGGVGGSDSFRTFSLTRVHNTGVAFGMAQGNNLLTGLLALGILIFAGWMAREWDWRKRWVQVVAGLVAGGAVGNLIDRMRVGYVIDFLDFHYGRWSWPAFNVADAAISIGVGMLVLSWLSGQSPESK